MKRNHKKAFSLMEVLLSVTILALGMIFVATQFPMGLANAREVAEKTQTIINEHNTTVQTELNIRTFDPCYIGNGDLIIDTSTPTLPTPSTLPLPLLTRVRFLCQPNIRIDSDDFVMDDPTDNAFDILPTIDFNYDKPATGTGVKNEVPNNIFLYDSSNTTDTLSAENYGTVVYPPVTRDDPAVQAYLDLPNVADITTITEQEWAGAIYDTALERNYATATLYRSMGNRTLRLYNFTLRISNKNLRYPVQDISTANPYEFPEPYADTEDRKFPIPWRVDLDPSNPIVYDNLILNSDPLDRFVLNDYTQNDNFADNIETFLREGSVLVESSNGQLFYIEEIYLTEDSDWMVKITPDIKANIYGFWIFPPAFDSDGLFTDQQPVISVAQQIVQW